MTNPSSQDEGLPTAPVGPLAGAKSTANVYDHLTDAMLGRAADRTDVILGRSAVSA